MDAVTNKKCENHCEIEPKVQASGLPKSILPQPVIALSGLGFALGTLKTVWRKFKRAASPKAITKPKITRFMSKIVKSSYVKYPAILFVIVAAVKRARVALNQ